MHPDRILGQHAHATGVRSGLLFILWVWMSLATAIVCAVVPAGLPSTRTVGSAFDPSTTIVALRSKAPAAAKLAILRSDDGGGARLDSGGGHVASPFAASATITAPFAIARGASFSGTLLFLIARPIGIARYARPPPLS